MLGRDGLVIVERTPMLTLFFFFDYLDYLDSVLVLHSEIMLVCTPLTSINRLDSRLCWILDCLGPDLELRSRPICTRNL